MATWLRRRLSGFRGSGFRGEHTVWTDVLWMILWVIFYWTQTLAGNGWGLNDTDGCSGGFEQGD